MNSSCSPMKIYSALSLHLGVVFGEASGTGLFVEGWEVVSCLAHYRDEFVEADTVGAVGERAVDIGIQGSGGSVGVALDARDLNKSADRVAGHAEMMLQTHFGSIFYLRRGPSKQLIGSSSRHRTCHTDLTLTANFRSGDGSILFHYISDESGSGQGSEDSIFRELTAFPYMI